MTFSYDDDADVLYVTFVEHNGPVVYLENESGDILRIAEGTGNIAGQSASRRPELQRYFEDEQRTLR